MINAISMWQKSDRIGFSEILFEFGFCCVRSVNDSIVEVHIHVQNYNLLLAVNAETKNGLSVVIDEQSKVSLLITA